MIRRVNLNCSFTDLAICFYIGSIILANGTVLFYGATVFLFTVALPLLFRRRMPLSKYLIWSAIFIIYHGLLIVTGIAAFPKVSLSRLTIVILNYIISLFLFFYFLNSNNQIKGIKIFLFFSIILIIYGLITDTSNVFTGRFGDSVPYLFGLSGVNGINMNSNDVGRTLSVAVFLVTLYMTKTSIKSRKIILLTIILVGFTALTGSRAALVTAVGFLLLYYFFISDTASKKIRYFIFGLFALVIGYFIIMRVPMLYAIIGQRVEILFTDTFREKDYIASKDGNSTYYRLMMFQQAKEAFEKRPILGWGLFAYSQMDTAGTYSHSNVMEMLVSGGLIGFILYYAGIFSLLNNSISLCKTTSLRNETLCLVAILIVTTIISSVTMDFVNRISLFEYAFIAGVIYSMRICMSELNYAGEYQRP